MEAPPAAALRGALGASCGGHDCCAHGATTASAPAAVAGAEAASVVPFRDALPWPCELGDGSGEPLLEGDDLLFAALASCGAPGGEDEDPWVCKHVHTTAPPEQPGGAPQTTCHHTHVRVCKRSRARRGAGSAATASEARGDGQPSGVNASRADAPAPSAGDAAAAAADGESSGGDDAPPERKRCGADVPSVAVPREARFVTPALTRAPRLSAQQPRGGA